MGVETILVSASIAVINYSILKFPFYKNQHDDQTYTDDDGRREREKSERGVVVVFSELFCVMVDYVGRLTRVFEEERH